MSDSRQRWLRVQVIGLSGVGKSTLSEQIADALDLPCIEADALYWLPDWTSPAEDEFLTRLRDALAGDRWVLDARQDFGMQVAVAARTQLLVWLDLPLTVVLGRVIKRTFLRRVNHEVLWAGNVESWWLALLVWGRSTLLPFYRHRDQYREICAREYPHARLVRLRSTREVRRFITELGASPGL